MECANWRTDEQAIEQYDRVQCLSRNIFLVVVSHSHSLKREEKKRVNDILIMRHAIKRRDRCDLSPLFLLVHLLLEVVNVRIIPAKSSLFDRYTAALCRNDSQVSLRYHCFHLYRKFIDL